MLMMSTSQNHAQTQQTDALCEHCLAQMAQGDMAALEKLYACTNAAVYGFALSILRQPQSAEDVMQDTYVAVYSNAASYRPMGKPMAWILTIVRNLARMRLRKKSGTDTPLEDSPAPPPTAGFEQNTLDRLVLQAALGILGDDERQIVMLHSLTGLKHREIAALLELPLGTVLSKYRRALPKLQNYLKEEA
ncbi:MAG: RNA polymerase sigma factor [Ruminococcaceae bacterium]|mgnify:CR=1 FL=1|nr:RNA polymerase sigma factor [Oscillospiraceae bacterium]